MTPGQYDVVIPDDVLVKMLDQQQSLLDRAKCLEDFDDALDALGEWEAAIIGNLSWRPTVYRPSPEDSALRELVIPHGRDGYIALFHIVSDSEVVVVNFRHQKQFGYR